MAIETIDCNTIGSGQTIINKIAEMITELNSLAGELDSINTSITSLQNSKLDKINYYAEERNTGVKWTDGRDIFQCVYECGNLPNNTTKSVNHNISGFRELVSAEGMIKFAQYNTWLPIPYSIPPAGASIAQLAVDNDAIRISTSYDASSYQYRVILRYTKN